MIETFSFGSMRATMGSCGSLRAESDTLPQWKTICEALSFRKKDGLHAPGCALRGFFHF